MFVFYFLNHKFIKETSILEFSFKFSNLKLKKKEPIRNVLSFEIISLINFDHFMGGVITWGPLNPSISFPIARTQVLMTTRFFWCACFNSTCLCLNCNTNDAVLNNYTLNIVTFQNLYQFFLVPILHCKDLYYLFIFTTTSY